MLHDQGMAKKPQLSEIIISLPNDGISINEKQAVESRKPDDTKVTASQYLTKATRNQPPRHSNLYNITYEGIAFTKIYMRVRLNEIRAQKPYRALTTAGRFNHYLVDPLSSWYGQNKRVLTSASLAQVEVLSTDQSVQRVINGSSHNYANFYSLSEEELELHRMKLPVADVACVSFLHGKMLEGLADFWDAKCCFSTSTGYQSNLLGIPAIAGKGWLILLDEKSHNSIFTACYLAGADTIKKFKHNNMKDLRRQLENSRGTEKHTDILVIVEGLYSMDGMVPPLGAIFQHKNEYGFLVYVDEAHSFGSIGRSGRGILELWNDKHPDEMLPLDLIDIRSGALSKAVGGLGGFVYTRSERLEDALRTRSDDLQRRACGSLTTATILRTLSFLAHPKRLRQSLDRLRDISTFCHDELKLQGIYVYGDENLSHLPILPVFGGRPSKAAKLSLMLRKHEIAAAPVSTPAVDIWESRVRMVLSPSFTDNDVNTLVAAILSASQQIGLRRRCNARCRTYSSRQHAIVEDIADETS